MAYTQQGPFIGVPFSQWNSPPAGAKAIDFTVANAWDEGIKEAHDLIAAGVGTAATAYRRVAIWNGTNYVVNGAAVTSGNRVATTYYSFLGGPDPNALGLMVDGDEWKDAV